MSLVWRKIQRANKKSAKYLFTITPKELFIVGSSRFEPDSIIIACIHRRRRIESKQRKWEGSFADPHRSLIVWPAPASDHLRIETTLYGDVITGEFDDKDWTVVIEEVTSKHKRHPIAAVSLNMRLFIQSSTETTAELKLKLRPLREDVLQCLLQALITSHLISENEKAIQSEVSSVSEEKALISDIKTRKVESLSDEKFLTSSITSGGDIQQPNLEKSVRINGENDTKSSDPVPKQDAKLDVSLKGLPALQTPSNISLKSFGIDAATIPTDHMSINVFKNDAFSASAVAASGNREEALSKNEPPQDRRKADLVDEMPVDESKKLSKLPLPEVIDGEDLLSWCQRVTEVYPSLKVTDFRKSFRSGLAFCAIIHRYRPGLIGDFSQLDFTESGRKENYRKAFAAARILEVKHSLDLNHMMVLSPEANEENVRVFLISLREVLEGKQSSDQSRTLKASDHRRSASYNISESEALVMRELENLRKQREEEDAVDFSNVMDQHQLLPSVTIDGGEVEQNLNHKRDSFVSASSEVDEAFLDSSHHDHLVAGLVSPTVAARHEELKKKRQTLNHPTPEVSDTTSDTERTKRLRKEARRLMENAALEGKTTLLSSSFPCQAVPSTSSQANISLRSFESIEPKNDLRCLEVVTPPVNIYNFKKIQPSPVIQRKKYDAPIIPAFQLPSQRLSTSSSDVRSSVPTTFDRVRRYGSMRSQELADAVAKMAGLAPAPATSSSSTEATPTRKLVSRWEKYNSNVEKIQDEQTKVAARLAEVSRKDDEISSELKKTVASSVEEENLLREHMQLLSEKDALVRKSEYLNVLEQLADVEHEIAELQKKLGQTSSLEDAKTEDDKRSIDKMMEDLVELVNKKDHLSQKLIQQEAEDEEMNDRDRRTLEAATHFKRGFEQPISKSRRLITWFRSEITG